MSEEIKQEVEQELDESKEIEKEETKQEEPMVSVAEMKRRLKNERERIEQEKQQEIEEATKLAKMNEEEKKEFEFEKLQDELAELKRKDAFYGLSQEASKMLTEQNIQADEELLQLVVKEDAEGTQKAVNSFVGLINRKVEEGVQKALSGSAPRVSPTSKQVVTQKQFDEMGYADRVALKQKNEELYNKLNK